MFEEVSRELLRQGLCVRFRPGGRSMQPTIRDGEAITVAPVRADEVKRGDILLYSNGVGLIAHRVLKIEAKKCVEEKYFILRGDSSVDCDEPVAAGSVLGRVVSVERSGRTVKLSGRVAVIRRRANTCATKLRSLTSIWTRF
jgi:signal peptidase I